MPFASKLGNDLITMRVILSDGNSKELQVPITVKTNLCAIWLPNLPQARKKQLKVKIQIQNEQII